MKKILQEVYTALRRFQIFVVIDSKIHQTLHFYLKSTKTNRPAKVTRVLSGKFIESSTTLLNRARLHKCSSKYAQQTCFNESKLWKQICIKLTFILFEKCPNPLNYWITSLRSRSITRSATSSLPFNNFRCHTITNNLFFLPRSWFLRSSVNWKSKFTDYGLCPQRIFPEFL